MFSPHAASRPLTRHQITAVYLAALLLLHQPLAFATNVPQTLPFTQDWSNTALIATSDDWSGVPGIIGYRGDDLTTLTGTDPQTIVADGTATPIDVNANQANPNTFTTGGVAEFEITNPTIALQGSGTADAPFILIHLNTTGFSGITVSYNLRDIDGSADTATQAVAAQYRAGSTGDFTNLPGGFVADATTGPNLAVLVTPVIVALPAAADNQPLVQFRVITTNAPGNDEWVGIDDILVTGVGADAAPSVTNTTPANGAADIAANTNIDITFSEAVNVTGNWFQISCATSGMHTAAVSGGPTTYTLNPDVNFSSSEACTVTVFAAQVSDQDVLDPPDNMAANHGFTFTVIGPVTLTGVTPNKGATSGGTAVTLTGMNFQAGATVTFGGVAATNVVVVNPTTITATTPAHTRGLVDVVVTNPSLQSATLAGGYRYGLFDPDGDNALTILDVFYLINHVFVGGPAPVGGTSSGDADADGDVDATDIFILLDYLFGGGPEPA